MSRTLPAAAFAAALLAFAGAASATEVNIRITTADREFSRVGYHDRDQYRGDIQCIRAPCYPARERPRWDHGSGWGHGGWGWGRPVVVRRGGWDRHDDDCRTIVKRRVNHWGEVITERTRVCY